MEFNNTQVYVIKKRGFLYWREGDRGYTNKLSEAKKFSEEEASEITNRPSSDKTMHLFLKELKASTEIDGRDECTKCGKKEQLNVPEHSQDWGTTIKVLRCGHCGNDEFYKS